jgi:solute carrier family 25 (mitochondrial phosphate transporter), member 3
MSHLYPTQDTLRGTVYSPLSAVTRRQPKSSPYMARAELYGAFSVVDTAKDKAQKLSEEATKEFEKASAAAQSKAGKIELFSGKYYATCTIGGMMACVCLTIA